MTGTDGTRPKNTQSQKQTKGMRVPCSRIALSAIARSRRDLPAKCDLHLFSAASGEIHRSTDLPAISRHLRGELCGGRRLPSDLRRLPSDLLAHGCADGHADDDGVVDDRGRIQLDLVVHLCAHAAADRHREDVCDEIDEQGELAQLLEGDGGDVEDARDDLEI